MAFATNEKIDETATKPGVDARAICSAAQLEVYLTGSEHGSKARAPDRCASTSRRLVPSGPVPFRSTRIPGAREGAVHARK
jgi:hypothetical protein